MIMAKKHKGVSTRTGVICLIFSLPIIAFAVFGFIYDRVPDGQDNRTIATVTRIWNTTGNDCAFQYEFEVDTETFTGGGSAFSSDCHDIEASGRVNIAYDPTNPDNNSPRQFEEASRGVVIMFLIIGGGMLVFAIYAIRKPRATKEQMKIIERGMKELGKFYAPPRKRPTYDQAKEKIDQINAQIVAVKKRPSSPKTDK